MLAAFAAGVVLSAAVTWVAGQRIKSPAEVAAETAPPTPALITVPVELLTLSQDVVVRGTVAPSEETTVTVTSTSGSTVVTGLPKEPGSQIEEGDVVVEVAGRPVIALQGRLPAFRNLIPGMQADEVQQLEEALIRLGYDPGTVDETFTAETSAAVEALYRDRGYSAPETDSADQANLTAAEAAVTLAEQTLVDAEAALADASAEVSETELRALDLDIRQAEVDLAAARSAAETANAEAAAVVKMAEARLADLNGDGDGGQGDQATIDAATAELATSRDEATRVSTEQQLVVDRAALALTQATEARSSRTSSPDVTSLQAAVNAAKQGLSTAQEQLRESRSTVGAWLPVPEVMFLPSLPRQVAQVFADVGEEPTGAAMTITGADVAVNSRLAVADRPLVTVGDEALIVNDQTGATLDAVVTYIADTPGGGEVSDDQFVLQLEPEGDVPDALINLNLRVVIPITSSGGDVLAVPLAALSAGPDGTARIEIERSVGRTEFVDVFAGLQAEGMVEVEPLEAALSAGDRVIVGRDLQLVDGTEPDEADS